MTRAIADLTNGLPIMLNHSGKNNNDKNPLIFSLDSNNQSILSHILTKYPTSSKIQLLLTSKRIKYLLNKSNFSSKSEDISLCNGLHFRVIAICDIIHTNDSDILSKINAISGMQEQESGSLFFNSVLADIIDKATYIPKTLDDCLLYLAKISEILPAFLYIDDISIADDIIQFLVDTPIQQIETPNVLAYRDHAAITKVCAAPLILEDSGNKPINANIHVFRSKLREHYAIVLLPKSYQKDSLPLYNYKYTLQNPLVRLHSSCFTGDLLRSIKCDCYSQLHKAIDVISQNDEGGIILYLNQEGRSIGLSNKLRTYCLQEYEGLDTVEANGAIGLEDDARDFSIAAQMLLELGIDQIKLLSNNPDKSLILKRHGIHITKNIVHIAATNPEAKDYLKTKMLKLGHANFSKIFKS